MSEERCPKCNGSGRVQKTRNLEITIPRGVDNNSRIRLSGEGEADAGGSGDLYVVVHIKHHPRFNRRGKDLHTVKEIYFTQATLGAKTDIKTINGDVETLIIPEGTQNGEIFRIKNKGMPGLHGRGGYGDLYVEIHLVTPKKISRKARKLLEEFNDEIEKNN